MKSKKTRSKNNKKQEDKNHSKTTILVLIGIALLSCPIVFLALINYVFLDAPNSAWIIIGYIGAFIVGAGLFNAIMGFNKLSLGKKATFICIIAGGILIAIGELLVFNSHLFDKALVSYYFVSMIFIIATLIPYWAFRGGVNSYLRNRKGLSKTNINKHKKGKRNYWWYEALHNEFGIGKIYHLNKIYTILLIFVFFFNLIFGFFKIISVFTCALSIILYILSAIMGLFGSIQDKIGEYGRAFVLFAKSSSGKIDSSIFDLFFILLPAGMAYAHIIITVGLWI